MGALIIAQRLSRPGARLGQALIWLAVPVLAMGSFAAVTLLAAAPAAREHLVYGVSSSVCTYYIAILSVPPFLGAWWVMKRLAPTRPLAAGAACGLVAGALGALAYALHCPEMGAPFVGIWYSLGMLIPAITGALSGPLLLRW